MKYFPTIGKSGLLIWRYLLRRDDPSPAPWTDEGKRLIQEKNLKVIVSYSYKHKLNFFIIKSEIFFN